MPLLNRCSLLLSALVVLLLTGCPSFTNRISDQQTAAFDAAPYIGDWYLVKVFEDRQPGGASTKLTVSIAPGGTVIKARLQQGAYDKTLDVKASERAGWAYLSWTENGPRWLMARAKVDDSGLLKVEGVGDVSSAITAGTLQGNVTNIGSNDRLSNVTASITDVLDYLVAHPELFQSIYSFSRTAPPQS